MTPTIPAREHCLLPVEADAARIFGAFQATHDELEQLLGTLADVPRAAGETVTEVHLAALLTIRFDFATLRDELDTFAVCLDGAIRAVVAHRADQQLAAV